MASRACAARAARRASSSARSAACSASCLSIFASAGAAGCGIGLPRRSCAPALRPLGVLFRGGRGHAGVAWPPLRTAAAPSGFTNGSGSGSGGPTLGNSASSEADSCASSASESTCVPRLLMYLAVEGVERSSPLGRPGASYWGHG